MKLKIILIADTYAEYKEENIIFVQNDQLQINQNHALVNEFLRVHKLRKNSGNVIYVFKYIFNQKELLHLDVSISNRESISETLHKNNVWGDDTLKNELSSVKFYLLGHGQPGKNDFESMSQHNYGERNYKVLTSNRLFIDEIVSFQRLINLIFTSKISYKIILINCWSAMPNVDTKQQSHLMEFCKEAQQEGYEGLVKGFFLATTINELGAIKWTVKNNFGVSIDQELLKNGGQISVTININKKSLFYEAVDMKSTADKKSYNSLTLQQYRNIGEKFFVITSRINKLNFNRDTSEHKKALILMEDLLKSYLKIILGLQDRNDIMMNLIDKLNNIIILHKQYNQPGMENNVKLLEDIILILKDS
ncbi:hypothetical protein E4K63_02530 [Allofrancisella inopinata]|uniref:Uncharacterized protein n=2 Tax=Allofrancisella inopinata TaxID=1085647 RepID=A0AAE6YHX9_9GAMM|nr:hypothetical protein E4K63_02530 [Allofrancisella inopinata]